MKIYSTQNQSPLELPSAQFPAEGLTINLSQVNCMELAIDRTTEKGKKNGYHRAVMFFLSYYSQPPNCTNIHIRGVPQGLKRQEKIKKM